MRRWVAEGACCFDPARGHLCLARSPGPWQRAGLPNPVRLLACLVPGRDPCPRGPDAERFSLLRKLTITEPHDAALELCLAGNGGGPDTHPPTPNPNPSMLQPPMGAPRVAAGTAASACAAAAAATLRLERLVIGPCAATEVKVRCRHSRPSLRNTLHMELALTLLPGSHHGAPCVCIFSGIVRTLG